MSIGIAAIRRSITWEIGVFILIVEAAVLALIGANYVAVSTGEIRARLEQQVQLPGELMSRGLLRYESVSNEKVMSELVGEELQQALIIGVNNLVYYSLVPESVGKRLDTLTTLSGRAQLAAHPRQRTTFNVKNGAAEVLVNITPLQLEDGRLIGYLYIESNTNAATRAAQQASLIFLLGSIACLAATLLVIILTVNYMVTRRLAATLEVVRAVGSGDLAQRVDHADAPDEIGELQRGINHMTTALEERRLEHDRITEELERERAFLSTAIDILPLPIMFVSREGTPFRLNRALREITGNLLPEQLIGEVQMLDAHTQRPVPPEEWPSYLALAGTTVVGYESIISFASDGAFPILAHAAPIFVGGKVVAAVVAFQNITKLKEADRAKDQFLMILSHELKTPLTSIIGWAQAAEDYPDKTTHALQVILRNAQEQRHLLEDLLDVSRIVSGRFMIQPHLQNLWELIRQCIDNTVQFANSRSITIVPHPPDEPLQTVVDANRIKQAVNNLLNNAIKYTAPGGTVWVQGRREDNQAVITIRDNGRGITAEEIDHLFQPFTQYRREEAMGGLGLGLSLVRGIVDSHGGTVSASSPGLGQGSTFTIRLPLREE